MYISIPRELKQEGVTFPIDDDKSVKLLHHLILWMYSSSCSSLHDSAIRPVTQIILNSSPNNQTINQNQTVLVLLPLKNLLMYGPCPGSVHMGYSGCLTCFLTSGFTVYIASRISFLKQKSYSTPLLKTCQRLPIAQGAKLKILGFV